MVQTIQPEKQMPESVRLENSLLAQLKANSQGSELQALRRLLEARLTQQDRLLRQCQLADFPIEQGKARVYVQLLKDIFESPNQR